MLLPFSSKIQELAADVSLKDLQQAYGELSERYRDQKRGQGFMRTDCERIAYMLVRMPATYGVCLRVLEKIPKDFSPLTSLDLGAGFGSLSWALSDRFPDISTQTLLEKDTRTLHFGQVLDLPASTWASGDMNDVALQSAHDIVGLSYALSELPLAQQAVVVKNAWEKVLQLMVIIEPGTPEGFEVIRRARTQLLGVGATILAPCTHGNICPMGEGNWCHFSESITRSSMHQLIKGGTMGVEMEKYAYLIVAKEPYVQPLNRSRILGNPIKKPGHLLVDTCSQVGLKRRVYSKKDKDVYRTLKKAHWGDVIS